MPSCLQHTEVRTIKFLARLGEERNPLIPDVPTMQESGIDMVSFIRYGIFGPAGMPDDVVATLNEVNTTHLRTDDAKEKLAAMRIIPNPTSAEVLRQTQIDELATWGPVVEDLGIVIE